MPANYAPGRYTCQIESQALGPWKNDASKWVIALEFRPLIDLQGQGMPLDVKTDVVNLWLSENALKFTIAKLRALGWHGDDIRELDPGRPGGHSFVGAKMTLVCAINDGGYNRWDFEMASNPITTASAKELDMIANRLRPALAMTAAPKSRPTAPAVEPNDIPF